MVDDFWVVVDTVIAGVVMLVLKVEEMTGTGACGEMVLVNGGIENELDDPVG